jgi:hypothetical protein
VGTQRCWVKEAGLAGLRYVLRYFGKKMGKASEQYVSPVEDGIAQGRRPDFTDGGLIRSLGGWEAVKKLRRPGHDRIKRLLYKSVSADCRKEFIDMLCPV